ncbi:MULTISPECIES: NADPH-dependent aldehyde reductase Ahr [Hyphobacterium]|uniref:NAD(P)-dependent alcohol dehydrogenase n=1 Tax=Hyphobacterium vulgare TaxID=1736751 RepID=A0ABV6ZY41_9PROT
MIRAWAAHEAGGKLTPFEYDPGPLPDDEVEIAVETCGLCHSDMSLVDDEWNISAYPLVPGHEIVGRIVEAGPAVKHLKVGDRVGVGWFAHSCLGCHTCMSGQHNLCADATGVASAKKGRFGGFAERVRAQGAWAIPIPDGVDAAKAGPLFCGGLTVFYPFVHYGIRPTDRVGIIGIGGLGHMALKFARAWGCEVTAFTSSPGKEEEAKSLGAHRVVNSRDKDALKAERGRFDMVLSTVNVPLEWARYVQALAPDGRLNFVGAATEPMGLAPIALMGGQAQLSATSVGTPAIAATMLEFCARHGIAPQTEHMKMSQINEAFDHLREGKARYRIVLENDFA